MSAPKLSEIYWHAACELDPGKTTMRGYYYTCDAIGQALLDLHGVPHSHKSAKAKTFYPLTEVSGFDMFSEFPEGLERQSARFLWLCMLAEIAESEGN
jgi:hypothetical protein